MSYSQEIFDAVRSKITGGNVGDAVSEAARAAFDISWAVDALKQEFLNAGYAIQQAAEQHARPSAVFKPTLSADGTAWMMLLGDNLQEGIAGFGDTPEEAAKAFDKAWFEERPPAARIADCRKGDAQ